MTDPPVNENRLVGQTLGHYRVAEKIGAGGMGEVYRAPILKQGKTEYAKLD